MIKQYDKVKLVNGNYAIIVEILETDKAYIADIDLANGDCTTDTIFHMDIAALIDEVERPVAI